MALAQRRTRSARVHCRATLAVAILTTLLSTPAALAANGASPVGISAKSAGRGGTDAAVASGALSAVVNPALLTELGHFNMDGSLLWLFTRTRFRNDLNDRLATSYDTFGPAFGIAWGPNTPPLGEANADTPRLDASGSALHFGLNVFGPAGGGSDIKLRTAVYPEGEKEGSTFSFISAMPSVAWRLQPDLSIGLGVHLLYLTMEKQGLVGRTTESSNGQVFAYWNPNNTPITPRAPFLVNNQSVTWADVFSLAGTSDSNASSRITISDASGFGLAAHIGFLWKPASNVSLGLHYRSPGFVPEVNGDAEIDANRAIEALNADPNLQALLQGVLETYLPDRGTRSFSGKYDFTIKDFDLPAVLGTGVAWQPTPNVLLAMDVRWLMWSQGFGQHDVKLEGGSNNDINEINGTPDLNTQNLLGWRDQLVVALGATVAVNENVVVRAGYNYGRDPIPSHALSPSAGIVEHHATLGATYYFNQWDLDFAYVYALPNTDKVTYSQLQSEYDGLNVKAEQHFLYIGFAYAF